MRRRTFLGMLMAGGVGTLLGRARARGVPPVTASSLSLPGVQVNPLSTELVLNSRKSYHRGSGYAGTLPDQVVANVLWAASRAPMAGSSRTLYVALPTNVYRYDPARHELVLHLAGNHLSESALAFDLGIISDLEEDAGAAVQCGMLASTAFWTSPSNQPCNCPREQTATYATENWNAGTFTFAASFGLLETVSGATSTLVAVPSDSSLPSPSTDGYLPLETALDNLDCGGRFLDTDLTLDQLSQLAWASYGNTPHTSYNGRGGLTVGSEFAGYYLSGKVYVVRPVGVERYHVRLPGGDAGTRDHRIERVTDGDRRTPLRDAVTRISRTAPDYFVYCATSSEKSRLLEAGFAGASAALQAASLGVRSDIAAGFSASERVAIIDALGIPASDLPLLVMAAGHGDERLDIDRKLRDLKQGSATSQEVGDAVRNYMQ